MTTACPVAFPPLTWRSATATTNRSVSLDLPNGSPTKPVKTIQNHPAHSPSVGSSTESGLDQRGIGSVAALATWDDRVDLLPGPSPCPCRMQFVWSGRVLMKTSFPSFLVYSEPSDSPCPMSLLFLRRLLLPFFDGCSTDGALDKEGLVLGILDRLGSVLGTSDGALDGALDKEGFELG